MTDSVEAQLARCREMHGDKQIKVTYIARGGYVSQAYVNEDTLEGTNKHWDAPVVLQFVDDETSELTKIYYRQIDDWEWVHDGFEGLKRVVNE